MPPLTVNSFVNAAQNLPDAAQVELRRAPGGGKSVVQGQGTFGTRTGQWFRSTLNIKDPATQAFKTAVRTRLNGDEVAAQRVFQRAGIHAAQPLTVHQIKLANQKLTKILTPAQGRADGAALQDGQAPGRGNAPDSLRAARQAVPLAQVSAAPLQAAPPGKGAAQLQAFSDAQAMGGFLKMAKSYEAVCDLNKTCGQLQTGAERAAMVALLKPEAESLFAFVKAMVDGGGQPGEFEHLLGALHGALAKTGGGAAKQAEIEGWFAKADATAAMPKREAWERLGDVRDELATLKTRLADPDADRTATLKAYGDLGGKLLAAVLEAEPDAGRLVNMDGLDGRLQFDAAKHADIAGLLSGAAPAKEQLSLLPLADPGFAAMLPGIAHAFTDAHGGLAGVEAFLALKAAGVDETLLQPLLDQAKKDVAAHDTVSMFALHGLSMTAHSHDYGPVLARAIALGGSDKPLDFAKVMAKGVEVPPPPLKPEVDLGTVPTAKRLDDLLGGEPLPKGAGIEANGRTLRFELPDNRVIALKLMRSDETPSKLQREHNAFGLMQTALEGDYPARPRSFEGEAGSHALIRVPKDLLPKEARDKLAGELQRGGLTLAETDGHLLAMSYEVAGSKGAKASDFFAYLEETGSDKAFVEGFESSMGTLGKMAAKGYFDPNLIKNSYHDRESGRGWVWSPSLLSHRARNTGEEEQPLANAKWSNFRVGGLADPDEFRHISHLQSSELKALLGDGAMAKEIEEGNGKGVGERLLGSYLVGRMVHESVVVATRRMVLQGAFDAGTPPQRRQKLMDTFRAGVTNGLRAFAGELTGLKGTQVDAALKANGLDLDQAVDGMLKERAALYSFDYADRLRERDSGYFSAMLGVKPETIQFNPDPGKRSRAQEILPRAEVLKAADPVDSLRTSLPIGWVSVTAEDANGRLLDFADLGWMHDLSGEKASFMKGGLDDRHVTLEATPHGALLVHVKLPDGVKLDDYMGSIKPGLHELQNTGANNGGYYFVNEQAANHLFSSTLVSLLAR